MAASRGRADGSAGATTAGAALEGIVERDRIVERLVENAPEELRRRRQWVVRKGKIPYNARTGAAASSTDSETWSTFDQAVRAQTDPQSRGRMAVATLTGNPMLGSRTPEIRRSKTPCPLLTSSPIPGSSRSTTR